MNKRPLVLCTLAAAVAPAALVIAPALAGADDALVVLSGSMVPTFGPGDVVFVRAVTWAEVGVGDIITFVPHPGAPVPYTHRVTEVIEDQRGRLLRTQGDANEDPDPMLVTEALLVGRVTWTLPWYGHAIAWFEASGRALSIMLISITLATFEMRRLLALQGRSRAPEGGNGVTFRPVATGAPSPYGAFQPVSGGPDTSNRAGADARA